MPIVKVELPSKEAAARVRSESPRLKRSEFPDVGLFIVDALGPLMNKNWIFRNIAESRTVAPNSL